MSSKVPIEIKIISDTICPWCIVGYERMRQALQKCENDFQFTCYFSPYLLNQKIPEEGMNYKDYFRAKGMMDINLKKFQNMSAGLKQVGATLDHPILFAEFDDQFTMYNTVNSHRLSEWCLKKYGQQKQVELYTTMMRFNFEHRKNIYETNVLLEAIEKVGLNKEEAKQFLDNPNAAPTQADVKKMVQQNQLESGAQGVPFFIINGKVAFSGAQDTETFVNIFNQVKNKPELQIHTSL